MEFFVAVPQFGGVQQGAIICADSSAMSKGKAGEQKVS